MYIIYKKALRKIPAHVSLDGSAACGAPVKCFNVALQISGPAAKVSRDQIGLTASACDCCRFDGLNRHPGVAAADHFLSLKKTSNTEKHVQVC